MRHISNVREGTSMLSAYIGCLIRFRGERRTESSQENNHDLPNTINWGWVPEESKALSPSGCICSILVLMVRGDCKAYCSAEWTAIESIFDNFVQARGGEQVTIDIYGRYSACRIGAS